MTKRFLQILLTSLLLTASSYAGAQELRFASLTAAFAPRHLPEGGATIAPRGYVRFCQQLPEECVPSGNIVAAIRLEPEHRAQLERINYAFNVAIEPVTDLEQYGETDRWTYADSGKGDCEDYVLEKRRALIQLGWPASVLLITVVRDHNGDGHAVLTVVTDQGDLILDNQEDRILSWKETGYRFVKRQSRLDPSSWVSLGERIVPQVVGSRR
ncbi:transglutaminase-like cysteine peptidase [Xanthobacter sp. TB0136]|uniref:transglutaminase-like cysteine peptidase n=1 Tax=Xanthobacter sp. TB0136 TaxID=3459177 RepID=UPI00403A22ED